MSAATVAATLADFGAGSSAALPGDEAAAIVRALASAQPRPTSVFDDECVLCGAQGGLPDHAEACPYRRAVAWVSAHDGPEAEPEVEPEVEPPLWDDGPGKEPWQRGAP